MKDLKTVQWLIVGAVGLGITLLWGCQNTGRQNLPTSYTTPVSPQPQKTILTYGDYLEQYPRNAPVEDVMEYVLRYGSPEFGSLRDSVLKEKPKFRQMASACLTVGRHENGKFTVINYPMPKDGRVRALLPEFLSPIQLEPGVYLIRLRCLPGVVMNTYSFFIYTDQKGINPNALKLPTGLVTKAGKFNTYESTKILAPPSGFSYDSNRRELQVTLFCRAATGSMDSRTIYKYENKNLSLLEYWQDDPKNDGCIQEPHLRQFYP